MTIEDLRTMRKNAIQQRNTWPQLQAAVNKQGEISSKLQAARAAKDVESVIKLQAEMDIINSAIETLAADADKLEYDFSEKEILDFWSDYVKKYNRDFDEKYQAYCKARAELCKQFSALVYMQKEIAADRSEAMKILGIALSCPAGDTREIPAEPHTIKPLQSSRGYYAVESDFYAAAGEISRGTAAMFSSVISSGPVNYGVLMMPD